MKLTKVEPKYKSKYVIEVEFMHGDGDAYTTEDYICDDEVDCQSVMEALGGDVPTDPSAGGDEDIYNDWCLKVFKSDDFVPYDTTCDCQFRACYSSSEPFYYDENGDKFEVKF